MTSYPFVGVGISEIAQALGVSRQRVDQLTREPGFPTPIVVTAGGRIWRAFEVKNWAKRLGRDWSDNVD